MTVQTSQHMRFSQLDRIVDLVPGRSIRAERAVESGEDFLRDHFPLFAVLPGVLMLEALYQASCWLILVSNDFNCGLLTLSEARNVKFADFVAPGQTLQIDCELVKSDSGRHSLKCSGTKGDVTAVSARLVIDEATCDFDFDPGKNQDRFVAAQRRRQYQAMFGGTGGMTTSL